MQDIGSQTLENRPFFYKKSTDRDPLFFYYHENTELDNPYFTPFAADFFAEKIPSDMEDRANQRLYQNIQTTWPMQSTLTTFRTTKLDGLSPRKKSQLALLTSSSNQQKEKHVYFLFLVGQKSVGGNSQKRISFGKILPKISNH